MKCRSAILLFVAVLSGCWVMQAAAATQPIDLVPMYGGVDRQSVPELKKGDDAFIKKVSAAFGGRENAYDMQMRAYTLGLREASFLADFGRVSALRVAAANDKRSLSAEQRAALIAESENYYEEAVKTGQKLGYVYDSWSSAKYWTGDYAGAWEKVKAARAHDAVPNAKFLAMLSEKMREPK